MNENDRDIPVFYSTLFTDQISCIQQILFQYLLNTVSDKSHKGCFFLFSFTLHLQVS